MHPPILAWFLLIIILCLSTFGIWWCVTLGASAIVFIIGGLTLLYLKHEDAARSYYTNMYHTHSTCLKPGLAKVVQMAEECPPKLKLDRRLTGSQVIDESLQEIVGYVLRDYVSPWYDRISIDEEFPYHLRHSAQEVIVTFAGRMKDVDWIPYFTTRLVDDAASHLRLFRQAHTKFKQKKHVRMPSSDKSVDSQDSKREYNLQTKQTENTSETTSVSSCASNSGKPSPAELESLFFDFEVTMEDNVLCRDLVCTNEECGRQYLQDVSEVILYLLLPVTDFHCKPLRFLLRELLVSAVLLPIFNLFCDPDYINQIIIWLCKDVPMTSEVFLTTLRITDNVDELNATRELVVREIAQLRSHDSGGEDDASIKQQLNSLVYVRKLIDNRAQRLQEGSDTDSAGPVAVRASPPPEEAEAAIMWHTFPQGLPSHLDWNRLMAPGCKLFSLPLDVVLKNNIALSYFIDYMSSIGAQAYLFFYLNAEGWRVSAEQQVSDMELQKIKSTKDTKHSKTSFPPPTLENMREAAYSIYEQYLSEKASPRLKLDESVVKRLVFRIRSETPNETWFDEIQAHVYDKLQSEERFLPGFRNSVAYVKLLAELDLLKDPSSRSDEEDSRSLDEISLSDNVSLSSLDLEPIPAVEQTLTDVSKHLDASGDTLSIGSNAAIDTDAGSGSDAASSGDENFGKKQGPFIIAAEIIETGIVNDHGKTYGIYAIAVSKIYQTNFIEKWHVYRRYSDFYDLYQKVKDKYGDLGKLTFPGKKTFHNMERAVLEKRMKMLNDYLQILLQSGVIETHPQLQNMLLSFLEAGDYDKGVLGGQLIRTFDNLVNPFKTSMRTVGQAVRTMPDNLLSTVDGVMDGISKVFQGRTVRPTSLYDSMKVGASLHIETDDNIPLRIMLLLMDEVFDLKSRNQWLRRRIVTLLRQIIRTMFGDIVNRRILDYVSLMTSPEQVADYLRTFKQSFWPNGIRAEPRAPRDEATQIRTRVAAKVALLSSLSDELKHIIGSETTRKGLLCVFELFQHPVLNQRLLLVIFEGMLETLFPQHNLPEIFRKLHSRSSRVRDDFKSSQRSKSDLRR